MAKALTKKQETELIEVLKYRFEKNSHRHKGIKWETVQSAIENQPAKIRSLYELEISGGEPDVVQFDKKSAELIFCDCSPDSPKGRRSLCYDREALNSRKEHKPKNNVVDVAMEMGVELLTEEDYRKLQSIERFDNKTSSWIRTPDEVRKLGGALFCDFRFGRVFVYHNGAESYYAARGFRALLRV